MVEPRDHFGDFANLFMVLQEVDRERRRVIGKLESLVDVVQRLAQAHTVFTQPDGSVSGRFFQAARADASQEFAVLAENDAHEPLAPGRLTDIAAGATTQTMIPNLRRDFHVPPAPLRLSNKAR